MKLLNIARSRGLIATLVAGFAVLELLSLTGCVVPGPDGGVTIVPPPLPGPPTVNIATYGEPTRYYYRDNPVYLYEGRRVYYTGGQRYYFRPGWRHSYRNGYYYYY